MSDLIIIECSSNRDVPNFQIWMPQILTKDYTVAHAEVDYTRHFGVKPHKVYRWGNYLYFEKPEDIHA